MSFSEAVASEEANRTLRSESGENAACDFFSILQDVKRSMPCTEIAEEKTSVHFNILVDSLSHTTGVESNLLLHASH